MSHVEDSTSIGRGELRKSRSKWMKARRSGDYGGPGGVHLFGHSANFLLHLTFQSLYTP